MEPIVLVVQTFVKVDTLAALTASLLNCDLIENTRLIFWCDHPSGSRKEEEYTTLNREVTAYIKKFIEKHERRFLSIDFIENDRNIGTCMTCKISLDFAFSKGDFVIFSEDDVIFSQDALKWFDTIRYIDPFLQENCWAIAGESIFFDAKNGKIDNNFVEQSKICIDKQELLSKYIFHQFVPSTCFATTYKKWREFSDTRGQPCGDVDVCNRCVSEDKNCIFPIVPRVKDTGMLHALGYSILMNAMDSVVEHNKNTYILSDMLNGFENIDNFVEFSGDAGILYRQSTLLEGFGTNDLLKEVIS